MPSSRTTLRQVIDKAGGVFVVPAYQRRYVWGQLRPGEKDSAAYMIDCLIESWDKGEDLFLHGITLAPTPQGTELVDGQQRLTCLWLLLKCLVPEQEYFQIKYACRPHAQAWMDIARQLGCTAADNGSEDSQDAFFFRRTLATIMEIEPKFDADFVLDHVYFLCIELADQSQSVGTFEMMNGAKAAMTPIEIIKADLMRLASDTSQPGTTEWWLADLRSRYALEWESWLRWWNTAEVKRYYAECATSPLDLLLRLCLRTPDAPVDLPLTYEELRQHIINADSSSGQAARHLFGRLRRSQKRFEEAMDDTTAYNRIRAILLLQEPQQRFAFLHSYFVDMDIDDAQLEQYYKLSFLGMTISEIRRGDNPAPRLDDLVATLGQADVYHTGAKREVFSLLLRLNIDEDIKLQRRFDFSIWNNRSLEHIYSKSMVWHTDANGKIYDGNDNELRMPRSKLEGNHRYLCRSAIVNHDGIPLSEHCIGNLVLLYGQNNAEFGNVGFEQKKMMFLAPGNMGIFRSRNLLHSVCVFAGNTWTAQSIIDNYNLTLKNLKIYYGCK